MEDSKLENVLRKLAIGLGIALLAFSIHLSYDGFDQQVGGGNSNYTTMAMVIGYTLAITFSMLEFIVSSRAKNLNTTLIVLGLFAYGYSIVTNFLGAKNLLQMDNGMAAVVALFMDIVPEPLIAWGLGEALVGDFFGNLGKFATSPIGKSNKGGGQQSSHQGGGGKGGGGGGRPQHQNHTAAYRSPSPEVLEKLRKNGNFHMAGKEERK